MALEDLLKGILGGAPQGGQQAQDSTPDLTDLLGGLLGGLGGGAQPQGGALPRRSSVPQPQSGAQLPDLIGGILGGLQHGGDLGGVLGGILGGGNMTNNALLGPISNALSEQFGLDPKVAQMVVIFALTTVVPAILKRLQAGGDRRSAMPSQGALGGVGGTGGSELDLDDLLERMGGSGAVGRDYLRSTGLSQQLSAQTGLDQETAEDSLQQTLFMLGRFMDNDDEPAEGQQGDMKDLLDSWDD